MAQRDLTSNTRNISSEGFRDPFQEEVQYTSSSHDESSSSRSYHNSAHSDDELNPHYHQYNGYYSQNNTTSNLISHSSSYDDKSNEILTQSRSVNNSSGSGAQNQTPSSKLDNKKDGSHNHLDIISNGLYGPEYDRYSGGLGSRVVSSTSLASQFYKGSPSNSDPLLGSNNTDFSPFGGYPASSFPLHIDEKEADDYLHNPDPIADADYDKNRFWYDLKTLDRKALGGLIGFIILFLAAAAVFVILPALTYSGVAYHYKPESYEILTHYSYPLLSAIRTSLIDPDTPEDAHTHVNKDGDKWTLVFSDEFNVEGRTFYEEDDQFFEAPDLHYDATKDLEWYDPDAVTTANGTLNLKLDAYKNHDLFYRSGMVQSWNKFCFTQGLILISARLPSYGSVSGLWPGLWTMGNLGRPGYLATTVGVWPYTYDSCDAGITANQSSPDGISYLPGQKLSACVCSGGDHPNVGTGRGAPEIDIIEGEVDTKKFFGVASQSYQVAPMDVWYYPDYNFVQIYDSDVTTMNTYTGGPFQQAVSGTTTLNTNWYELGPGGYSFQVYGYEYLNDDDDGYITWYVGENNPTFTLHAYALAPNGNVGFRRISKEPMSIIMNLGISNNWAYIDWPSLVFPATFRIDYVRVYQPPDAILVGCDPDSHPTTDYIQDHLNAYYNVNLTTWEDAGYSFPKNKLVHGC